MRKLFRRKSRYAGVIFAVAVAVLLMPLTAQATLINFETIGGVTPTEGDSLGTEGIATFSVGTPGASPGVIAQVGAPAIGFAPNDTPNPVTNAGNFFLTNTNGGTAPLNYFVDFSVPVTSLSLDLYDYGDGGASPGAIATLTVFSDAGRITPVGSFPFTVPSVFTDGNVATLSVLSPSSPILAASLIFSQGDAGTGIDNINFSPVPEPSTLLLLGSGLIGVGFISGGRRRRKEMQ